MLSSYSLFEKFSLKKLRNPSLQLVDEIWIGRFEAMASPCEVLVDTPDKDLAQKILDLAVQETRRIEQKYSRYRDDNIVYQINNANGKVIEVDSETAGLLNYAKQCYELSEGMFDVTSGVLRKAWKFDGSDNIPSQQIVAKALSKVGWSKIKWKPPILQLKPGMEIDFGGVCKEYAVDRTALIISTLNIHSVLVNYGGDLVALGPRSSGKPWEIGLQSPDRTSTEMIGKIELSRGGVATSGDLHRFLLKDGVRYSHILNPKTGWPVEKAIRQVTVLGNTCMEAGMLATFALLQGEDAEIFIKAQGVEYRIVH